METTKNLMLFVLLSFFAVQAASVNQHPLKRCKVDRIYQLGDSISDTGNLVREPIGSHTPFGSLPYGETIKKPTGRCSDGFLLIDFLAMAHDLPLLNAYLDKKANFNHGVNFAVAGSTALNSSFLMENHILNPLTNSSLTVQLGWFRSYLDSLCKNKTACAKKLKSALFMVGEIGGNDYNYGFFQGKTIEDLKPLVPHIVKNIKDVAKDKTFRARAPHVQYAPEIFGTVKGRDVIELGAKRVVIPGNFPIGCFPIYLTAFKSNDTTAYDADNCLASLNSFAKYHNQKLTHAVRQLQIEHPNVTIIYADYYSAFLWVLRNAHYLGFKEKQKACCGVGGDYNFDGKRICGVGGSTTCIDPRTHISWDGIHLTQSAYYYMAKMIFSGLWHKFNCN